jgi:hypothetical protein
MLCDSGARVAAFSARPVAAAEHREAAFGCEAVVKPGTAVLQVNRVLNIYDCFAAERSLAVLGSCYKGSD